MLKKYCRDTDKDQDTTIINSIYDDSKGSEKNMI